MFHVDFFPSHIENAGFAIIVSSETKPFDRRKIMERRIKSLRFGGSGMRGEIGSALTPMLAIDFASALGTYTEGGKIVIASDARTSTGMLKNAVCSALISTGCTVLDAGTTPASALHYLVPKLGADGGILIGGGHHPAGWNALIIYGAGGAVFNSVQMQELLDIYHANQFSLCWWDEIGEIQKVPQELLHEYMTLACSQINTDAIAKRDLRVVMDFCNGSGGSFGESFAQRLGIKLIPINNKAAGILPHSPEPRPRSAIQVQSLVQALNADIGFVFNTDMSRFSVVTGNGETLSEEYSFPLVADYMLSEVYPAGTAIVTNGSTTRTLDDIAKRYHAEVSYTKAGPSAILDRMIEINAPLGGEGSGSAAFLNIVNGFDSFHAVARILESMAVRKCRSEALADQLPRYHVIKRSIACPSVHGYTALRSVKELFPEARFSEVDGYRFDFDEGMIHLRAATTEPIIRMMVEWKTREEAEDRAVYVRGILERLVAL